MHRISHIRENTSGEGKQQALGSQRGSLGRREGVRGPGPLWSKWDCRGPGGGDSYPWRTEGKGRGRKAQPDQGGERSETARLPLSQDGSWGPPCSRVRIHTPAFQPLKGHGLEKALWSDNQLLTASLLHSSTGQAHSKLHLLQSPPLQAEGTPVSPTSERSTSGP